MAPPGQLTFRLRKCPCSYDQSAICELLNRGFPDIQPHDVLIHSLAPTLHRSPWEDVPMKTATLTFRELPLKIKKGLMQKQDEWSFSAGGRVMILDTHFIGMTPLSDINEDKHEFK